MLSPPSRSRQWLSQSLRVFDPFDDTATRLTLGAPRAQLRAITHSNDATWLAWLVAATLTLVAQTPAHQRTRGSEISIRIETLRHQSPIELTGRGELDTETRASLIGAALQLGASADIANQRAALRFFQTDVLTGSCPILRITANRTELEGLGAAIHRNPLAFVIQLSVRGTGPLVNCAPPRPRGRSARGHELARIIAFLACLADEAIRTGDPRLPAALREVSRANDCSNPARLEIVYILVEHAMQRHFRLSLEEVQDDHVTFAQTYLYPHRYPRRYPHRAELGNLARKALAVPGVFERLFT